MMSMLCLRCKEPFEVPEGCKDIHYSYCENCLQEGINLLAAEVDGDPVRHPAHYADTCSIECIDVMELVFGSEALSNFCMINAFKYLWRHKHKNGAEDLDKAQWYLDRCKPDGYTVNQLIKLRQMVEEAKHE